MQICSATKPPHTVTETVLDWEGWKDEPLSAFLDSLLAARARMTEEQYATAVVTLMAVDDNNTPKLEVTFRREETGTERDSRLAREEMRERQRERVIEADERATLAWLKAKYEPADPTANPSTKGDA